MVSSRLFAIVLVLGLGALLFLLLVANAALAAVHAFLPESTWASDIRFWVGVKWLLLIGLLTLLFAMIYKLLPYAIITWRDVWIGAFITALFFVLGNYLIEYFLSWIAPGFAYWAASSLVVLMLWVYYSSQSLLFGAEFTKNFANRFGDPARPAEYAMFLPGK
jgi:membrane protein